MHVCVVGADSAIGAALTQALHTRGHQVVGTTRRAENVRGPDKIFLDLAAEAVTSLPATDVVVICAAMARFEDCRRYPDQARCVNVFAPKKIAERALHGGGRVILLSTSAVFDCLKPRRRADEPRTPRSMYGCLKAEAEAELLSLGARTSVLRLTKIVQPGRGIFQTWIEELSRGGSVKAFMDHTLCPLPLSAVVDALAAIVENREDGIFQVSGADDLSYAEAARLLAGAVGVSRDNVTAVPAAVAGLAPEDVTPFTSLDTSRLHGLTGFVSPNARDVLLGVYARELSGKSVGSVQP
ncbi:MAG TPA: sugar nucleotide-binding protein [Stellaceae bacterium]|nr:sugar nucleotide-binding protein [Stellaceae bacterium]